MKNLNLRLTTIALTFACSSLIACGQSHNYFEEENSEGLSEAELNAPLDPFEEVPESEQEALDQIEMENQQVPAPPVHSQQYNFPAWQSAFGITQSMYTTVKSYYEANRSSFPNQRYVVIIDMGLKSNQRRYVLFDLQNKTFTRYLTTHGAGSDRNNDGYLDSFSNTSGSNQTSKGFYRTVGTYTGKNGRSLRLAGLSSTNSNAMKRAVVMHGANYVREKDNYAGRSNGCPALDHKVVQGVIDKVKGGALMYIGSSRAI